MISSLKHFDSEVGSKPGDWRNQDKNPQDWREQESPPLTWNEDPIGVGSGGSSGFDSDSAPSSITYQSSLSTRAPLSDFTEQGARPKSSGMTKLSSIEVHREESGLFPLRPAGGIHRNRDETSSSSLRPVHGPQRSTDLSEHSGGLSDAGYHSLVPSRSPTVSYNPSSSPSSYPRSPSTSFSTSSFDTSSTGGKTSSAVWNVRATRDTCPSSLSPRHPRSYRRSTTPLINKNKLIKKCQFDKLPDGLVVKIISYLTSVDIINISRTCKRLYFLSWEPDLWTSLTLTSANIETDRAIKSILEILSRNSGLSSVRSVCLNGSTRLTDRGLAVLARRAGLLRQLEVQYCPGVTNGGLLDLVSRCPHLVHLDITGCPMVTTVSLPVHPSKPRPSLALEYLDLSDCNGVDDTSVRLAVENCPQIQYLFLRRCSNLTDTSLKYVASYCLMLRELSISDCSRITDSGLAELAKLGPSLRYLSVAKCHQLTDTGVKQLVRHCYKLRYLNLRGCERISDLAVEAMSKSCSRLRSLDIGKCDVTDLGLRDLSVNCPNLKKLSVRGCEMVTDQGLINIAYYCRGLQQLNIQDVMGVTVEGYRNVKKYCRKCIIEHTNPGLG